MSKQILTAIVIVMMVMMWGVPFIQDANAAEPIKIGAILAVTGPAAFLGAPEEKTVQMLAEQINANGGINGQMLELIVKDSPHYAFVGSIKGVKKGRAKEEDFVEDALTLLRSKNLNKSIAEPEKYSWQSLINEYVDYFKEIMGE